MKINVQNLTQELRDAGITTHGNCNSNGVVWDDNNKEIQARPDVKAVIAKHDPTPIPVETFEEKVAKEVAKQLKNK